MRDGGNCLKYLKRVQNRKEERGKVRSRDGYLKKGVRSWNPLTNYVIHALNILLECIERNFFFKIGEPFNVFLFSIRCRKNMID